MIMKGRRFAIPDVHGCAATLRRLVEKVIHLTRDDELYLLGDLIDRGPDPRGVLDYLLALGEGGYRVASVRGNHEQMLLDACRDRDSFRLWLLNGGHATLESFGVEDACEIPLSYRKFLTGLPYYLLLDDFVLVHGCLDCRLDDPFSDLEAILWSRDCPVDPAKLGGRRVVCGHTPQSRELIRGSLTNDRIMLDNGCVFRGYPGLGSLTALELNTLTLLFEENCD